MQSKREHLRAQRPRCALRRSMTVRAGALRRELETALQHLRVRHAVEPGRFILEDAHGCIALEGVEEAGFNVGFFPSSSIVLVEGELSAARAPTVVEDRRHLAPAVLGVDHNGVEHWRQDVPAQERRRATQAESIKIPAARRSRRAATRTQLLSTPTTCATSNVRPPT